jgi:hypothetical protein
MTTHPACRPSVAVLALIAVAARPPTIGELRAALRCEAGELRVALRSLVRAGLVEPHPITSRQYVYSLADGAPVWAHDMAALAAAARLGAGRVPPQLKDGAP